MLKLNVNHEDYWIELDKGIRVLVRPLTTYIMQIAQNNVKRFVKFTDPDTPVETKNARLQTTLTEELACAAIVDWEGVYTADGSKIAEVDEETITDLMSVWYLSQKFFEKYTSSLDLLYLEGNGSGSAANGTSAAALNTAEAATSNSSPAQ